MRVKKQKKIGFGLLCIGMLVMYIILGLFFIDMPVSASTIETESSEEAVTLYVQSSSLAVRPAKNSTELLGRLAKGDKVTGYREGVWIRTTYNGKNAYIAAKYTDTNPPPTETFYVKAGPLAVRPAKNSTELLGRLAKGDKVTGYREGVWIRTTYSGQTAYIAAQHTDTNPVLETLYVKVSTLAVRPAKNSTELLGRLAKGDKVTGYREGVWIRTTYNGKNAYIAAQYTDTKPVLETLYVKVSTLAVRPAKNSTELLGRLRIGDEISGYREGVWFKITYKSQTAYVAIEHLQTDPVKVWSFSKFSYRDGVLYVHDSSGNIVSRRYVGDNHILVSLNHQYMWAFNNNKLIMETPIISGKTITPTVVGNFAVVYKDRCLYLGGTHYVDYWMPFYRDYGIHDAHWQDPADFYMYSTAHQYKGSAGCVNVPPANMATVFNNSSPGTPVTVIR